MFGFELVEEVVTGTTFYQSSDNTLVGSLCRTSSGVRFVTSNQILLAIENEEIETVRSLPIAALNCSRWRHLGCKALIFTIFGTTETINFAVPDAVAKSWSEHFQFA